MADSVKQATDTFKQECKAIADHRVRVEQVAAAVNNFAAECQAAAKSKNSSSTTST